MRAAWLMWGWLLPWGARAEEVDGHGLVAPPASDDPRAPVRTAAPERFDPGSVAVSILPEIAGATLVMVTEQDPGSPEREAVVGGALGADLQARWALSRRVALGASLPLFGLTLGTDGGGPAAGDLHLWMPIGLVMPRDEGGFGLAVLPFVHAPTGAGDRWLGDAGWGGGGSVIVGVRTRRFDLAGSLGVEQLEWSDDAPFPNGPAGRWSLAAGAVLGGSTAHVELFGRSADSGTGQVDAASPAELHVTWRRPGTRRGTLLLGLGRAISSGAGAASFRAYAGATISLGARERHVEPALVTAPAEAPAVAPTPTPVALEVRATDREGTPLTAEVVVQDEGGAEVSRGAPGVPLPLPPGTWIVSVAADGMGPQTRTVVVPEGIVAPIALDVLLAPARPDDAGLALTLRDVEGRPLRDVEVVVDGEPVGTTSTGGDLGLRGLAAGPHEVAVRAEGFVAGDPRTASIDPGASAALDLVLRREPGAVRVRVVDDRGRPVEDATLRLVGPARFPSTAVGPSGEKDVQLRSGPWTLFVSSPTHGLQQRDVVVPEDDPALVEVTVVLRPSESGEADLSVRVVDPDGAPVPGAEVWLDGASYGATSTGGTMVLTGLDTGPRTLTLRGARLRDSEPLPIDLTPGAQEQVVTARWISGLVRFSARDGTAPVEDATVRLTGAAAFPPLPLGPDGVELATVVPGDWQAAALSPSKGLAGRAFSVAPDGDRLIDVDLLLTGSTGDADLTVRVTDPRGRPLDGAEVRIDGDPYGETLTGAVSALGLSRGTHRIEVVDAPYTTTSRSVKTTGGGQEIDVPLAWGVGAVEVTVRGPDGPVADAVVRLAGDGARPPTPVGPDGSRLFALTPGTWLVLVTSRTAGVYQQEVVVPATPGLTAVDITLAPPSDGDVGLLVRVLDEDGRPVVGATVRVDGVAAETSAVGAAIRSDLTPGAAALQVEAAGFEPWVGSVSTSRGTREQIVVLPFVRAPLTIEVRDPSGDPVDAELTLEGPETVPSPSTGADGSATVRVRPGPWTIVAASATRGTGRATATIEPGGAARSTTVTLTGESRVETTASTVSLRDTIPFDFDQATLRPESGALLSEIADTLRTRPDFVKVEIQGHTDRVGGVAYNYTLSTRRAEAVVAELVRLGVPPERLVARGYGSTRPLVPEVDEATAATNRRVAFEVVERSD